jgi:hypothetical protein
LVIDGPGGLLGGGAQAVAEAIRHELSERVLVSRALAGHGLPTLR